MTASYSGVNDNRSWIFDASAKVSAWTELAPYFNRPRMDVGAYNIYDGDGRLVKRVDRARNPANGNNTWVETPEYTIFSSVTGNAITELTPTGQKNKTSVYMGSSVIAEQQGGGSLVFKHTDPVTGAQRQTDDDGLLNSYGVGRIHPGAIRSKYHP